MERPAAGIPRQVQPVVSYEEDVHAWMYLDQVDGLLRYEAYVLGYDDGGRPATLEFVIEEGAFELSEFPQVAAFLPAWLRRRAGKARGTQGGGAAARESAAIAAGWDPARLRGGDYTPWDLAAWQWERLHAFCEDQERRLKNEHRIRWIRRLKALGYDVIRSLDG